MKDYNDDDDDDATLFILRLHVYLLDIYLCLLFNTNKITR